MPSRLKKKPLIVYNIVGTSRRKCKCRHGTKSWLHHWCRKTLLSLPTKCVARGCRRSTQVGAHVRREGEDLRIPWIVPFCQFHNKRRSSHPIVLKHGAELCKATMSECS